MRAFSISTSVEQILQAAWLGEIWREPYRRHALGGQRRFATGNIASAFCASTRRCCREVLLLLAQFQKKVLSKFYLQSWSLSCGRLYHAKVPALSVIDDVIRTRLKAAQFDFTLPHGVFPRSEKPVIHFAVFFDRVRLRDVIAINIKIAERSLRKHLFVVDTDPLFPVRFFLLGKHNVFELRPRIGPHKLGSDDSARANGGGKIIAVFNPVAARASHGGKLHVIAINSGFRAQQRLIHFDAATNLNRANRVGGDGLVHVWQPSQRRWSAAGAALSDAVGLQRAGGLKDRFVNLAHGVYRIEWRLVMVG